MRYDSVSSKNIDILSKRNWQMRKASANSVFVLVNDTAV